MDNIYIIALYINVGTTKDESKDESKDIQIYINPDYFGENATNYTQSDDAIEYDALRIECDKQNPNYNEIVKNVLAVLKTNPISTLKIFSGTVPLIYLVKLFFLNESESDIYIFNKIVFSELENMDGISNKILIYDSNKYYSNIENNTISQINEVKKEIINNGNNFFTEIFYNNTIADDGESQKTSNRIDDEEVSSNEDSDEEDIQEYNNIESDEDINKSSNNGSMGKKTNKQQFQSGVNKVITLNRLKDTSKKKNIKAASTPLIEDVVSQGMATVLKQRNDQVITGKGGSRPPKNISFSKHPQNKSQKDKSNNSKKKR